MWDTFRLVAQEPYEHRGIIHSEIALILCVVKRCKIERIIESGRARAQSTYMLAKYLPDVDIDSVELRDGPDERFGIERVKDLPNVRLHAGNGAELLPKLAAESDKPTAVICDGPKGFNAVNVVMRCFEKPQVRVGFIHDMRCLDNNGPSPFRHYAEERLKDHRFSDDPCLVAELSWMDANVLEAGGPCGPQHEAQFGSYGPTLGVFFSKQQQAQDDEP